MHNAKPPSVNGITLHHRSHVFQCKNSTFFGLKSIGSNFTPRQIKKASWVPKKTKHLSSSLVADTNQPAWLLLKSIRQLPAAGNASLNSKLQWPQRPQPGNTHRFQLQKSPVLGLKDSLPSCLNHGLTRIWIYHGYIQQTTTSPLPKRAVQENVVALSELSVSTSVAKSNWSWTHGL